MTSLVVLVPVALLALSGLVAYLSTRVERGSGDTLRARRAEQPLAHELPYWAFLDDAGVGLAVNVDLTYSTFLELQGLDTDCLDNEALNHIALGLHGVLQNLPAGSVLQFLHATDANVSHTIDAYLDNAAHASSDVGRTLIEAKARDLVASGGLRRSRLVLSISLPNDFQSARGRAVGFTKKYPKLDASAHEDAAKRLRTLRDQVARALQAAGIGAQPLDAAAVRRLAYEILNPSRARLIPDPFASELGSSTPPLPDTARPWANDQSAREQLAFSGLVEGRDRLLLDDQLVRVVTLKSLPTWTEPALLEALLVGLPFHCRIALAVEALDSLQVLDQLKRRRDQAHLLATLREKRNQEAEAQEQDVAELIDKNLRSSVRMVRIGLTVVLSVDRHEPDAELVLERQTAEVLRAINGLHGAQAMVDEHNQVDEFLATLPGNARHARRFRQATSENAAHMLLAWQSWSGTDSPCLLLHNGRGNLVALDPFDPALDNPNAFMAGSSGSGKSSTTNYLLLNLLAAGARALVIDVGGSYRRIIDIFGGEYFAITLEGGHALNPFFPPADLITPDGRLDERRAQFIAAVIERMVCDRVRPELRNVERAVLGAAIEDTYRATWPETPLLSDLAAVLRDFQAEDPEDRQIAAGLARDLRIWTEGPAARLVNRPSTVSLTATSAAAAFDLKGLETQPHLQSVVMLILSGIIWNLVLRDPTERKIVVFDEVWRLLESPASAQVIAELYRTSRKYRCSILTISQSVEDFTSSPIASALTQNSATVYLLRHRRGHELVTAQFRLNAREEHVFQSLEMRRGEYTEALVLHGEHHFLARVVLSPLEYWIATTHPADLALEAEVKRRRPGLSRLALLDTLAGEYPRGADASAAAPSDRDAEEEAA